jgi:hypothetical protein
VQFARGLVGPAFSFDGIDDYVDVLDTPTLHQITTAATVEVWIKPQLQPQDDGWIFARRDPNVSESFSFFLNNRGYVLIPIQTDVGSVLASAYSVIEFNGEWQHVAVTADTATGEVGLYVNGNPMALQLLDGSPNVSGTFASVSHLFIGRRESGADAFYYKGLIDEVGLYNRALTPVEIKAVYSVGRRGRCKAGS